MVYWFRFHDYLIVKWRVYQAISFISFIYDICWRTCFNKIMKLLSRMLVDSFIHINMFIVCESSCDFISSFLCLFMRVHVYWWSFFFLKVISASSDTTIKVWNAHEGSCLATLRTHKVRKNCMYEGNKLSAKLLSIIVP